MRSMEQGRSMDGATWQPTSLGAKLSAPSVRSKPATPQTPSSITLPAAGASVPQPGSCQPRLDSWKAIASYLGREVRTVQRWEKREQLPVRRHLHSKNGTVYAFRREIDEWRESRCVLPERAPMEEMVCGRGKVQSLVHWDSRKPAVAETSSQGATSCGFNEAPCLVFILWLPSSLFGES